MMLSGVPNLFFAFGYTNASWTLRSDLTARLACRLLNHMKRRGVTVAVPRAPDEGMERRPVIDFSSGYVKRAEGVLPMQGARHPWNVRQNSSRSPHHAFQPDRRGSGAEPRPGFQEVAPRFLRRIAKRISAKAVSRTR